MTKENAHNMENTKWSLGAKKRFSIILLAALILLAACSRPVAIETTLAYSNMEGVWNEFREKNPYNIQIEGIRRYEDNSYVVIISEPNERITEKDLQRFFKPYNCSLQTFKKSIGYDGWLRDAVIAINDLKEKDIPKMAKKLSILLYGTDYKASLMDFETIPEHTAFSSFDLNISVTEEELRKWFIEDHEALMDIDDTTKITTLNEVLRYSDEKMRILMSCQPGFIIWFLPRGYYQDEEFRAMARKFSIDSDLILGAIANNWGNVAIIARERCVPIYELPPMREETLKLLACTEEDELAQSYERTSLFAGKLPGGKDFAPIYLSDILWHTEYGNILNITDQMLKSWSEDGTIEYTSFNYPKPVNWTFDKGAIHDLDVSSLTYNWNTQGTGYIVEDDNHTIYALNRTGSLPVSYIPGETEGTSESDPVYLAEEKAYDFFSDLSSPELVKVVQYVSMYQIFRNICSIHFTNSNYKYSNMVIEVPSELYAAAQQLLRTLSEFNIETKEKIATKFGVLVIPENEALKKGYIHEKLSDGKVLAIEDDTFEEFIKLYSCVLYIKDMDSISLALKPFLGKVNIMNTLGNYLIDRNGVDWSDVETELSYMNTDEYNRIYNALINAQHILVKKGYDLQQFYQIVGEINITKCKDLYVSTNTNKSRTWMKCPTIVESWNIIDSSRWTGGHNLDSKITRFKVTKEVKPGEVKLGESDNLLISSKDLNRITSKPYLRKVARTGRNDIPSIETPVRDKYKVVGITKNRSTRGFNVNDHLTIGINRQSGHTLNGKKYDCLEDLLTDAGTLLEDGKAQFKQIEITGLKGAGVDVDVFVDGVACHMRKGEFTNIPMSKYDFTHYTVAYEGDKAIVTIPIKPGKIEFESTSSVSRAGIGINSTSNPTVKIKGGEVEFRLPKDVLGEFKKMISEFLQRQKGHWNDFKIKMEMRSRGIDPNDCEELTRLKVAKLWIKKSGSDYSLCA